MADETKKVLIDVNIKSNSEEQVKKLAAYKGEITELRKAQAELIKTEGAGSVKAAEYGQQIKALTSEAQKLEKEIQSNIKAQNQQVGSLAALKTQLSLDTAAYDKLSEAEKKSAQGKQLQAKIKSTSDELKKQESQLGNNTREVGNYGKATEGVGGKMAAMSAGIVAAIAAVKAIYAAVKESIDLFVEQEKQSFRVGDAFGAYSGKINAAADATQGLTTVGNEQYQKLAVLAKAYGTASKDVNNVVQQSIGLSTQFEAAGINQEQALKLLVKAQNGNFKAVEKIIPAIKNAATEQEKMNILNDLAAKGFETATKYAETYGGRMIQIKNATGDLKEEVGGQFLAGLFNKSDGKQSVDIINQINKALQETQIISKFLRYMREQTEMMIKPFINILKLLGDGESTIDGISLAMDVLIKILQVLLLPLRFVFAQLDAFTGMLLDLKNSLKNIENLKFQDVLNIYNEALYKLVEPFTDIIGLSDEVGKVFGIQSEQIKLSAEELDKYNKLLFDTKGTMADIKKQYDETVKATEAKIIADEEEKESEDAKKKAIEDSKNAYKSLQQQLFDIEEEYKNFGKTNDDLLKKSQAVFDAYKKFYASGGFTQNEMEHLRQLQDEILKVSLAAIEEIDDTDEAYTAQYEKQLQDYTQANLDKLQADKDYNAARLAEIEAATDAEFKAQEKAYFDEIALQEKAYFDKIALIEKEKKIRQTITQQSVAVASDILQTAMDNDLAKVEGNEEAQKQIRKKYAHAQALMQYAQIAINVQQAITKTIAELGGVGAITPAGAALIAGIIAQGIVSASLVKTQTDNIMKAERGTYLHGKRHAQGGILVEAEDGEVIINRKSTARFLPLLSAINESGGGVPFIKPFADGGYVSRSITTSTGVSSSQIVEAVMAAMSGIKIYTAVTDIHRESANYAQIEDRARF